MINVSQSAMVCFQNAVHKLLFNLDETGHAGTHNLLLGSDNFIREIAAARASIMSYFPAAWISSSGCCGCGRLRKYPKKNSSSSCSVGIDLVNCAPLCLLHGENGRGDSSHLSTSTSRIRLFLFGTLARTFTLCSV